MPKRRTPEDRFWENSRKQRQALEDYAAYEREWSDDLLLWYRIRKEEIPNDQYRAVSFIKSREYLKKPGSLTLLYETHRRCMRELAEYSKEFAFDLLAYRYKIYAEVLIRGGYLL